MTREPLDLVLATIKTTIKGDMKYKTQVLKREMLKFYEREAGINIAVQSFYPRPEGNYGEGS